MGGGSEKRTSAVRPPMAMALTRDLANMLSIVRIHFMACLKWSYVTP